MRLLPILLLLASLLACDAKPAPQAPAAEPSLIVQIEKVRTGQSTEIRLSPRFSRTNLPAIVALPELVRLNLNETDLTDEDVKQLASMPKLETLRFSSPSVTDASLAHLATSKTLRHLLLFDTPITDLGLAHLASLDSLESLYLTNTRVTDAGLSALLQRRPTLHVH